MLRVRFGGFSVLKITKGLKANWVDKISHFGGTAGLLTGVSYITFFEIIAIIFISGFKMFFDPDTYHCLHNFGEV